MKIWRSDFLTHTNFVTLASVNLFWFYKKVFIGIDAWMIGKLVMKHHYRVSQQLKQRIYYF